MSDEQVPEPGNRSEADDAQRGEDGRFGKGNRANLSGRPRALKEVQEKAARHTNESINTLIRIMRWAMEKPTASRVREARQCAVALLDRAWGKPAQPLTDGDGGPLIPATKAAAIEALRSVVAPQKTPPLPPPDQPAGT